jgi:hypothetical protein
MNMIKFYHVVMDVMNDLLSYYGFFILVQYIYIYIYLCSSLEIFLVLLSGIFLCVNIFLSFLYIYKAIKILRFSIYHFPF